MTVTSPFYDSYRTARLLLCTKSRTCAMNSAKNKNETNWREVCVKRERHACITLSLEVAGSVCKMAGSVRKMAGSVCVKRGMSVEVAESVCKMAGSVRKMAGSVCKKRHECISLSFSHVTANRSDHTHTHTHTQRAYVQGTRHDMVMV